MRPQQIVRRGADRRIIVNHRNNRKRRQDGPS
jgi:hypothetical protein